MRVAKPELEFFDTEQLDWTPVAGGLPGMYERILALDVETGDLTRLARWEPGMDTRSLGVQAHPYWEELYILEGSIHDVTLGKTFSKGFFACRPPWMQHGPWKSSEGCTTFEIRRSPARGSG
jgi:hypothetical protein